MGQISEALKASGMRLQKRIVSTTLAGIVRIQPLIHTCQFSSESHLELEKAGWKSSEPADPEVQLKKMPGYQKVTYAWKHGNRMTVYQAPKVGCLPPFILWPRHCRKEGMKCLYDSFPHLKISSIEYTIDFFCRNPLAVLDVFYVFRRYMYFHHAKATSMSGGRFDGYREPRDINAVYHVWFAKRRKALFKMDEEGLLRRSRSLEEGISQKYVKIYERGEDKPSGQKSWAYNELDRVRLEYTIHRNSNILQTLGTDTLRDLVSQGPRFFRFCFQDQPKGYDEIQFKNFKSSSQLPMDWQDFNATDGRGHIECLMEECFRGRRLIGELGHYMEDNRRFDKLKENIKSALIEFDSEWAKL